MRRHPIYFLRHGETESNAAGRMQGHLDSNLTAKGEAQAAAMASVLSQVTNGNSTDMVSSPSGRAVQTADIICRVLRTPRHLRRTDVRLREMTWGGVGRLDPAGDRGSVAAGVACTSGGSLELSAARRRKLCDAA
jgi:probable phosphoglycerate mutase